MAEYYTDAFHPWGAPVIVDPLSFWFVGLTSVVLPTCLVFLLFLALFQKGDLTGNVQVVLAVAVNLALLIFFASTHLLLFYVCFETTLVPIFLLILIAGSRPRKTVAAFYFFGYTFWGSALFLLAVMLAYNALGTLDMRILVTQQFSDFGGQLILWPGAAFSFATKIPLFPLHAWLPEAHVEAPTIASVYLASLLLKMGMFGFARFLVPGIPLGAVYFAPLLLICSFCGVFFCTLLVLREGDFKRVVAYSSIIHMNFALFGFFTYTHFGAQGCLAAVLAHGLIAAGLFLIAGSLYNRGNTRETVAFSGLMIDAPRLALLLGLFVFCNTAFPGTLNFLGELSLSAGILSYSTAHNAHTVITWLLWALFGGVCYAAWLLNKVVFGNKPAKTPPIVDTTRSETVVFSPLLLSTVVGGLAVGSSSVLAGLFTNLFLVYLSPVQGQLF